MAEIASLVIQVDSTGAIVGVSNLRDLERQGRRTESAVGRMGSTIKGALAQIGAAVSVMAAVNKLVQVSREFDVINASLITATGSAENAATAFRAIQEFASQTPYDLQQVSKAFVQLVNLGLDPSEAALNSYGNTAAAMGKDLSQLVEAVADATTGEFERLKEFGIKARSEGDQVSFTFRGVTTTVAKNAEEIENYIKRIGEVEFAGAMAERAKTLDGAISNLGDTWDNLFLTISQQGAGTLIYDSVKLAEEGVAELIAMIESGQLAASLDAMTGKFAGFGGDVAYTLDLVNGMFRDSFGDIGREGETLTSFLSDAFGNMPENVRAFIQLMTVELAAFIDKAGIYGQEIADKLKFWDGDTFDHATALQGVNDVRLSSIDTILQERDAAVKSYEDQMSAARSLREEYERQQSAKGGGDALAGFGIDKPEQSGGGGALSGSDRMKMVQEDIDYELNLMRLAGTEKEAIENESYLRRIEAIRSAKDQQLLTEREANMLAVEEHLRHQGVITQIEEEEARKRAAAAEMEEARKQKAKEEGMKALSNLSSLMNSQSKKAFQIGKIAAIASTAVRTSEAAMGAYSALAWIPGVGPALGAAAAGAAIAAGTVQIQQIKSQQFGGGGTVSGAGLGGGGTPGVYQPPQPTQPYGPQGGGSGGSSVNVVFNGPVNDVNAERLAAIIADHVEKTDAIIVSANSRNGQILANR